MGSIIGLSLWIALATVIPEMVTIAVVWLAFVIANGGDRSTLPINFDQTSDWIVTSIAVTVMVMTQALGIILEKMMIQWKWYGTRKKEELAKMDSDSEPMGWYDAYKKLYPQLARLKESDDAKGHLERAIAQFFMTNNTLVSFSVGLVTSVILLGQGPGNPVGLWWYAGALVLCLAVTYQVAVSRFRILGESFLAVYQDQS